MADVEIADVELAKRPSQTRVLVAALACGFPALALVLANASPSWIVGATALFVLGTFAAAMGMRGAPKTGCTARVTAAGLELDGTLVAARADLVSGTLLPRVRTHVLLTKRDGSVLDVGVLQLADARALLDTLGLGASRTTAAFPIMSPAWSHSYGIALWAVTFFAMLAAGIYTATRGGGLPILVVPILLLALLAPAMATVGTDAVLVRWLGMKRLIRLADVVRVERLPHVVRLTHRDGRTSDIHCGMPGRYASTSVQIVSALAERIEEALAARAAGTTTPEANVLARAERTVATWVDGLRRAATAEPGFRNAALIADRLWPLVEGASNDASTRVAAAVALAPTLDDEGRARVRVAASASASPKLRVALEAVAKDDVEEIVTALAEIEGERIEADRARRKP